MQQIETAPPNRIEPAPMLMRARVLSVLGWSLLMLSLVLLTFHVLWMWKRMGNGAPLVAIGLVMDALVGIGMIFAATRLRRRQ